VPIDSSSNEKPVAINSNGQVYRTVKNEGERKRLKSRVFQKKNFRDKWDNKDCLLGQKIGNVSPKRRLSNIDQPVTPKWEIIEATSKNLFFDRPKSTQFD
jgi:hypothetical protein